MNSQELMLVMRPDEVHDYLKTRIVSITGERKQDFAEAMGISKQQASDLLLGRDRFGKKMILRLNAIDKEFDLIQMIAVVRKGQAEDVAL